VIASNALSQTLNHEWTAEQKRLEQARIKSEYEKEETAAAVKARESELRERRKASRKQSAELAEMGLVAPHEKTHGSVAIKDAPTISVSSPDLIAAIAEDMDLSEAEAKKKKQELDAMGLAYVPQVTAKALHGVACKKPLVPVAEANRTIAQLTKKTTGKKRAASDTKSEQEAEEVERKQEGKLRTVKPKGSGSGSTMRSPRRGRRSRRSASEPATRCSRTRRRWSSCARRASTTWPRASAASQALPCRAPLPRSGSASAARSTTSKAAAA